MCYHQQSYILPLHTRGGLPYLDMCPPTDNDVAKYPHVYMCSDSTWDPSILDCEYNSDIPVPEEAAIRPASGDRRVDDVGNYINLALEVHQGSRATYATELNLNPQTITPKLPDIDALCPNFAWLPTDRIESTLDATTQYYQATIHHPFRRHQQSRFPAANVNRLNEWFSTDTIFSKMPAMEDGVPGHGGCTMLQLYSGVDSNFLASYPMASESFMSSMLEDFIRDHGAMYGLHSDNAKSEVSKAVRDIEQLYCIKDCQSEPHYQQQNPAERSIQDVKRVTNNVMDRVIAPAPSWLL